MTSTDALFKESEVYDLLVSLQSCASSIMSKVAVIEKNQKHIEDVRLQIEQVLYYAMMI